MPKRAASVLSLAVFAIIALTYDPSKAVVRAIKSKVMPGPRPDWATCRCDHDQQCAYTINEGNVFTENETVIARLVGGSQPNEGRVELYFNNTWGSICSYFWEWDIKEANTVCRMLGYSFAARVWGAGEFGEENGTTSVYKPQCTGAESNILDCCNCGWGKSCNNSQHRDFGVTCSDEVVSVRLIGDYGVTVAPNEGRVEIYYNNTWGTVCHFGWDMRDAHVVCRMLGYPFAVRSRISAYYGLGYGPIWMSMVACTGRENSITDCNHEGFSLSYCHHGHDAGVQCSSDDLTIRLSGGYSDNEGRVEIFFNNTWGTISDSMWDKNDANIICRMLGYTGAEIALSNSHFGKGSGPIWLTNVGCTGQEDNIGLCFHSGWGACQDNCNHKHDAGVVCSKQKVIPEATTVAAGYPHDQTTTITVTPSLGQSVELQCRNRDFKQWYTTGSQVRPTPNVISTASGATRTLAFYSFNPSHAGTYSCLASSKGDTQTKTTYPVVLVNPSSVNTIRVGRTDDPTTPITITPTLSQPIQLECERSDKMKEWFTGDPMSRVVTTRGEISLRSEQDSTLYISSSNPFHGKGYTCNVYGDFCSITAYPVILETPPAETVLPPPPQVESVMVTGNGTSLTVSWNAVTDPMYNILYVVRYSTDSGNQTDPPSNAMKRSGIADTSTTLTGLQSDTIYYVWVAAEILGAGVQGPYSRRALSGVEAIPCTLTNGSMVDDGTRFKSGEPCMQDCTCKRGVVVCPEITCPTCDENAKVLPAPDGECCDVCACPYKGRDFMPGATFAFGDGCNTCNCLIDGTRSCTSDDCELMPECSHDLCVNLNDEEQINTYCYIDANVSLGSIQYVHPSRGYFPVTTCASCYYNKQEKAIPRRCTTTEFKCRVQAFNGQRCLNRLGSCITKRSRYANVPDTRKIPDRFRCFLNKKRGTSSK